MSKLIAAFNNRELATLTWMAMLLSLALWHGPIRGALWGIVKAFGNHLILRALAIASLYIGLCVWLMEQRNLWTIDNLKTTIVWAISFAFVTMFDVCRITEDKTFFGKTIRETIGITALLLFVVEFYSFSYWIEFLTIPAMTFLQLMLVVAEGDEQHASVRKFLGSLLAFIGVGLFSYSFYMTVTVPADFFTLETTREFLVPIVLSALFLPFIYVFGLYVVYERTFAPLCIALPDRRLRQYAKMKAVLTFGSNLDYLKRWNRAVQSARPAAKGGINSIFAELHAIDERAAAPPTVTTSQGWSPYQATSFLSAQGLPTADYHRSYENEWFASATLFGLGDDPYLPSNLGYYVTGNEMAAKSLKLKLYVNQPTKANEVELHFTKRAEVLIESALGPGTRESLNARVASLTPFSVILPNGHASLAKELWTGGIPGGYDWTLTLRRG